MEAHRPEPEESWQNRQFDEQHRQVLDLFDVSNTLPLPEKETEILNKTYKRLLSKKPTRL